MTGDDRDPDAGVPVRGDAALTLVVPIYNEAARFSRFAPELAAFVATQPPGSTLLFVDDGSDDGTADQARAFVTSQPEGRAQLLVRPHQGKGAGEGHPTEHQRASRIRAEGMRIEA